MPPKSKNAIKSPEVNKAAVSVSIRDRGTPVKSPSRDYPNPDALAAKYGVDASGNGPGSSGSNNGGHGLSLEQQMEFMQKQQSLVQSLQSKNVEIGQLCTLLEAVEPMPGMDPEKCVHCHCLSWCLYVYVCVCLFIRHSHPTNLPLTNPLHLQHPTYHT